MPTDWSNTLIYKIYSLDTLIDSKLCYIGQTTDFTRRKNAHKQSSLNPSKYASSQLVHRFIHANGGWHNWAMVVLETCFYCKTSIEAMDCEARHCLIHQPRLNVTSTGNTIRFLQTDDKILRRKYNIDRAVVNINDCRNFIKSFVIPSIIDNVFETIQKQKIKNKIENIKARIRMKKLVKSIIKGTFEIKEIRSK